MSDTTALPQLVTISSSVVTKFTLEKMLKSCLWFEWHACNRRVYFHI